MTKEAYVTNDVTMPEELVEAMVSIGEMTDDIVRAIDEVKFRTVYLPMFVSTEKDVDLSPWLDVCGNHYESVNVVKDKRVIFVVPPLIKRHPTLVNTDPRSSAPTIANEARQYQDRHPSLGVKFLVENLGDKVVREGVSVEEVRQWNAILEYYGYPLIGNLKPDTDKFPTETQVTLTDDDFEEM